MAMFVASGNGASSQVLNDLQVLLDGTEGTPNGNNTQVTFGNDPFRPFATITLVGTNITGPLSASSTITEIDSYHNGILYWRITGLPTSGPHAIDGTPTGGAADPHSIFQAELVRNAPRLIFEGNDNTLIGGPGDERLFAFGTEGTHQVIVAGSGREEINAGGGINSVIAGTEDDSFLFNFLDANQPHANVTTIHGYNAALDQIELDPSVFAGLSHTHHLPTGAFHAHAVGTHAQIVYNAHNGNLSYDPHGTAGVHELFAIVFSHGAHHPALTAHSFFIV
jgi:hypothetical protein